MSINRGTTDWTEEPFSKIIDEPWITNIAEHEINETGTHRIQTTKQFWRRGGEKERLLDNLGIRVEAISTYQFGQIALLVSLR